MRLRHVDLDGEFIDLGDYPLVVDESAGLSLNDRLRLDGDGRLYRVVADDRGAQLLRFTAGAEAPEALSMPFPADNVSLVAR